MLQRINTQNLEPPSMQPTLFTEAIQVNPQKPLSTQPSFFKRWVLPSLAVLAVGGLAGYAYQKTRKKQIMEYPKLKEEDYIQLQKQVNLENDQTKKEGLEFRAQRILEEEQELIDSKIRKINEDNRLQEQQQKDLKKIKQLQLEEISQKIKQESEDKLRQSQEVYKQNLLKQEKKKSELHNLSLKNLEEQEERKRLNMRNMEVERIKKEEANLKRLREEEYNVQQAIKKQNKDKIIKAKLDQDIIKAKQQQQQQQSEVNKQIRIHGQQQKEVRRRNLIFKTLGEKEEEERLNIEKQLAVQLKIYADNKKLQLEKQNLETKKQQEDKLVEEQKRQEEEDNRKRMESMMNVIKRQEESYQPIQQQKLEVQKMYQDIQNLKWPKETPLIAQKEQQERFKKIQKSEIMENQDDQNKIEEFIRKTRFVSMSSDPNEIQEIYNKMDKRLVKSYVKHLENTQLKPSQALLDKILERQNFIYKKMQESIYEKKRLQPEADYLRQQYGNILIKRVQMNETIKYFMQTQEYKK